MPQRRDPFRLPLVIALTGLAAGSLMVILIGMAILLIGPDADAIATDASPAPPPTTQAPRHDPPAGPSDSETETETETETPAETEETASTDDALQAHSRALLASAIENNQGALALALLRRSPSLENWPSQPKQVRRQLLAAIANAQTAVVRELISQDADVNESFTWTLPPAPGEQDGPTVDCTPLSLAVALGDRGMTTLLLEHGATIEPDDQADPLTMAIRYGRINLLAQLLDHFPDTDIQPLLTAAIQQGRLSMIDLLASRGASLAGDGQRGRPSAIQIAIRAGQAESLGLLLDMDAPFTADDMIEAMETKDESLTEAFSSRGHSLN